MPLQLWPAMVLPGMQNWLGLTYDVIGCSDGIGFSKGISAMKRFCPLSLVSLVSRGFAVESMSVSDAVSVMIMRPMSKTSACPGCGMPSARVHSRYRRRLADPPIAGRALQLLVLARCFYCDTILCGRRIFTERVGDVLAPCARRTSRLDHIVHHLGRELAADLPRALPSG